MPELIAWRTVGALVVSLALAHAGCAGSGASAGDAAADAGPASDGRAAADAAPDRPPAAACATDADCGPHGVCRLNGCRLSALGIAAGADHTCALLSGGEVACWGGNGSWQLGGAAPTPFSARPVMVPDVRDVTALAPGERHTCVAHGDGHVTCWGANDVGQLGSGAADAARHPPAAVNGLGGVTAIASRSTHTCAVVAGGAVQCWGEGTFGGLGPGAPEGMAASPVTVTGLPGAATAVATGWDFSCALLADGTVDCWGLGIDGQLGDGQLRSTATPVTVQLGGPATALAAGDFHACALAGATECWGQNYSGEIGDGNTTAAATPQFVELGDAPISFAAGQEHSCAVLGNGQVLWWGRQLGVILAINPMMSGTPALFAPRPLILTGLDGPAAAVAAGASHACALLADGTVACWGGTDAGGQLGDGVGRSSPLPVPVVAP